MTGKLELLSGLDYKFNKYFKTMNKKCLDILMKCTHSAQDFSTSTVGLSKHLSD